MSDRRLTEFLCVGVAYCGLVRIVSSAVGKCTGLHLGKVGKGILN